MYKLDKTKMVFEKLCSINVKLLWPVFNYLKSHILNYNIKYICKYDSIVNYNIVHNKVIYKYFLKAFYRRINKKKYELQIL